MGVRHAQGSYGTHLLSRTAAGTASIPLHHRFRMDHNSNYKKNKYSHQPLLVFGHADTFDWMCHAFDIFVSETCHYPSTIKSRSETGTFAIMFLK